MDEPIGRLDTQQGFRHIRNCRTLWAKELEQNETSCSILMTVKLSENQNAQKDYLNQKLIESQLLQKNRQFRLKQSAEVISKLILSVPLKREEVHRVSIALTLTCQVTQRLGGKRINHRMLCCQASRFIRILDQDIMEEECHGVMYET